MNHDITHCKNEECRDKMICFRYLAHKEIVDRKLVGMFSYFSPTTEQGTPTSKGQCPYYMRPA